MHNFNTFGIALLDGFKNFPCITEPARITRIPASVKRMPANKIWELLSPDGILNNYVKKFITNFYKRKSTSPQQTASECRQNNHALFLQNGFSSFHLLLSPYIQKVPILQWQRLFPLLTSMSPVLLKSRLMPRL